MMAATHRSFAQRYHVGAAAADHYLSDSSVTSSPGRTRARRIKNANVNYAHRFQLEISAVWFTHKPSY